MRRSSRLGSSDGCTATLAAGGAGGGGDAGGGGAGAGGAWANAGVTSARRRKGSKRMRISDTKILAELAIGEWAKKKVGPAGLFWSKAAALLCGHQRTESPGDGLKSMS